MTTTMVRVPDATYGALRELAREQGRPIARVIADAVERYARAQFLVGLNADYARLRDDPAAWEEWQSELTRLEGTLLDGLENDPWSE